mmetsp:Transcript_1582/g.2093  ORF Transcript_1582/g.2093 Transcript_1582/m.2093 type:complete len:221 (+) Transcript_1582:44-706(+)
MSDATSQIIQNTIEFVKKELAGNDASHDWFHIERVWKLSKTLAREEKIENSEIVELAALLHDVNDWKYSGSETAGVETAVAFLKSQNFDEEKIKKVAQIIEGVGFKNELANKTEMFPELAVVQDADRLDAIGAIGIGRTFAYGGRKSTPMYDPEIKPVENITKEQYMHKEKNTTINHFYEKLLKLKDMMKTETGKKMAQQRHNFMEQFLNQFYAEWEGRM